MGTNPPQLPRFTTPPVIELAFGIQFDSLPGFRTVHYGTWRERIRQRFPIVQDQPPLDELAEIFDGQQRKVTLNLVEGFPLPRVWYISESNTELVQLQPNRFAYNWRKRESAQSYPSYATLKVKFTKELQEFVKFVESERLGVFKPNLCELTYINHIVSGDGWNTLGEVDKVLTLLAGRYSDEYLPGLERIGANAAWVFKDAGGNPLGRLRMTATPQVRKSDRKPLLSVQMIARGIPQSAGGDGIVEFMDRAHEWIVRGFAAVTTKEMHAIWGRTV